MLTHFPIAQTDELLTSILARFIRHMGIKDDKVALDILFGNRKVVPSAFLQGHLGQLIQRVGKVWRVHPRNIVRDHSHLPLFRPFLSAHRYSTLQTDLIQMKANPSVTRSGIPASVVRWPSSYKICPQCWKEQHNILGFSYWQRLFQSPGVTACPKHRCRLLDTHLPIQSTHRHHFVGADSYTCIRHFSEVAKPNELKLANMVDDLFKVELRYVSPQKWTLYYQQLARENGFMNGARIDHTAIANTVRTMWSDEWLLRQGLQFWGENTWLVAIFRKHRRVFSYLQHFIVCLSLSRTSIDVLEVLNSAKTLSTGETHLPVENNTKNAAKRKQRRGEWLKLLHSSKRRSLKQLRDTTLGARLYLWLYRYDRQWLNSHKPAPVANYTNKRVSWHKRDLQLVKQLIAIKNKTDERMADPRHSKSWFASQVGRKTLIEKKLYKLPLCSLFFDRYSESVEEYQVRRLCRVMVQLIKDKDIVRPLCEIERLAGLSHQRSRKPAREVLRLDIPTWQRVEALSERHTASSNRRDSNQKDAK